MKKKKKIFIILGIVILIIVIAFVVLTKLVFKRPSMPASSQKVSTVTLEKMDLVKSISATGTIESKTTKEVTTTVNNIKVKTVEVEVGDYVTEGQSLVTFDESDLQEAYDEAQENLQDVINQNQKNIDKAKKQLSNAKSDYSDAKKEKKEAVSDAKEAYTAAKKNVKNLKAKVEKNPDDQQLAQQLEQAEQALSQAESAYEQAKKDQTSTNKQNNSSIENAEDSLETAQDTYTRNVKEAQKQVDAAKENLEACAIVAPISGTVTAINAADGENFSGSSLLTIEDLSSLCVATTIDEYDIYNVTKGQRVVIKTDATDDEELEGTISFVSPTTKTSTSTSAMGGSSQTSSGYEVRIDLSSTNERLRLGMTAKCSIVLEEADDVYAVPYDAIHTDANGDTYITVGSEKITVTKGLESDYYVEISGEGLSDGLKVTVDTDAVSSSVDSSDFTSFEGFDGGSFPGGGGGGGGFPGSGGGGGGFPGGGGFGN